MLDFGTTPSDTASLVITGQTDILAGSTVIAVQVYTDTDTNSADEQLVQPLALSCGSIVAGTGFTIFAYSITGPVTGKFGVTWTWF